MAVYSKSTFLSSIVVGAAVFCAVIYPAVLRGHIMSQFPKAQRADLKKPEFWWPTPVDLIVPASPAGGLRIQKVQGRTADLKFSQPPRYEALIVIVDPHSGQTYVARTGQDFYLFDGSDLLACNSVGGFFTYTRNYLKSKTVEGDPDATIARFVAEVDDEALSRMVESTSHIDLRNAAPLGFFRRNSDEREQGGRPTMTAIDLSAGVLRLELRSEGGRYLGTFWMDLKAERLLRSVVDGKEFFKVK